ncbi:MAG: hypothetical protein PHO06_03515 [Clostridia bacterium]|nr:hypothetical protein [Clostridia bacterium]
MKKNFKKDVYSAPQKSYPISHSNFIFDKSNGGSYSKGSDSFRGESYDFDNRWDGEKDYYEYDGGFDKKYHDFNKFGKYGGGQWGKHRWDWRKPCNYFSRPVCFCKVCSVRKFCCCKRVPCHRRFCY